jgi:hypothetical protein
LRRRLNGLEYEGGRLRASQRGRTRGSEHGAEQVAWCVGIGQERLREANAECALEAQHQLDATETVEAEIPIKRMVERNAKGEAPVRMQHECKLTRDLEQLARRCVWIKRQCLRGFR